MTISAEKSTSGFTLVELIVGMSLSLMIMGALLSSYVFLSRNFSRSIGMSGANQPTLESQSRRTLAYFEQDARMASGVDISGIHPLPSAAGVTFVIPTGTGDTTTISYNYDSSAKTLARTQGTGNAQILQTDLLAFSFHYYDSSPTSSADAIGNVYSDAALASKSYISGIKQVSISFSCQSGSNLAGTLTQLYEVASPKMILRNTQLRP